MAVDLTPDLEAVRKEVLEKYESAEKRHKRYRDQWNHVYSLFRGFSDFKDHYASAEPNDRDTGLQDAQREWGAELFIPYCFATIETITPRVIAHRPRMLVLPKNKASDTNVENIKAIVNTQQDQIDYDLKLEETAKSGLIYGLGVQKGPYWRTEKRTMQQNVRGTEHPWVEQQREVTLFDDPDVEDVDIFDFYWDPFGSSIETCAWVMHRTWRSTAYVRAQLESGKWTNPAALPAEEVEFMASPGKYDETMRERMKAAGHDDLESTDDKLHEVWEFHDRKRIITLLDRDVPVQVEENPHWHGELPFHAYRPTTPAVKQLPGIGEIEPIEHLQREMNTLRSQRRDNAALKLMQVFAYADGLVERGDLQFFPGAAIPTNGDPRDLLFPINVGDIPNSGYQEEANLKADIEMTTGISDPVMGTGDASQTATGVQLVQAAANVRIQKKSRRVEVEICKSEARQFIRLNQQKILTNREVRIPATPTPQEPGRVWAWLELGPGELAGEFDIAPEGGSLAPDNVPQQRADAQMLLNSFRGDPRVKQRQLYEEVFRLIGIKAPDTWLEPDQRVPPIMLDVLRDEFKVPEDLVIQALQRANEVEEEMANQSPNAQQNGSGPARGSGQTEPDKEKPAKP